MITLRPALMGLLSLCSALPLHLGAQEVVSVDSAAGGLLGAKTTLTMLWENPGADLTLVLVLGHPGRTGLKPGDVVVNNQTARMMQGLVGAPGPRIHLVVFDSPIALHGVGARASTDHQTRLSEVVQYYQVRLQRPVWLMGHSDGSLSVSEFLNRSPQNRSALAGAILSASRNETRITDDWAVPTLMIHHERDGCDVTTYPQAVRTHQTISRRNSAPTEMVTVVGGTASGPPCSTGFHMYERAYTEVRGAISAFLDKYRGRSSLGGVPSGAATAASLPAAAAPPGPVTSR